MILASEFVCLWCLLFVPTMLFIYIATAATLICYCFRRCCLFFSPKDKYFILFLLCQIHKIMQRQHVLPNTEEQVCLKAKASERGEVKKESAGKMALQKKTNSHSLETQLTSNVAQSVCEACNRSYRSAEMIRKEVCLSVQVLHTLHPSLCPPSVCPQVACKLDNLDSSHQRCLQLNENTNEHWHYCDF